MPKKKGVAYWDKKLIGPGVGIISKYVKYRDAMDLTEEGKPIVYCITCDKKVSGRNLHAGHWISRRHKASAYDEHNIHGQCAGCNKWRNGEPQLHEDKMRVMYGDKEVDRIRACVGKPNPYNAIELEELHKEYKQKLKDIK